MMFPPFRELAWGWTAGWVFQAYWFLSSSGRSWPCRQWESTRLPYPQTARWAHRWPARSHIESLHRLLQRVPQDPSGPQRPQCSHLWRGQRRQSLGTAPEAGVVLAWNHILKGRLTGTDWCNFDYGSLKRLDKDLELKSWKDSKTKNSAESSRR